MPKARGVGEVSERTADLRDTSGGADADDEDRNQRCGYDAERRGTWVWQARAC